MSLYPSTVTLNTQIRPVIGKVADLNALAMRCGYKVVGVFEETASGASGMWNVMQQ